MSEKSNFMSEKPNRRCRIAMVVQVLLISNLLLPSTAYAYIDPGSGSVIVTTVLGLLAAIGYTFRKYFYKIKRTLFGKTAGEVKDGKKE